MHRRTPRVRARWRHAAPSLALVVASLVGCAVPPAAAPSTLPTPSPAPDSAGAAPPAAAGALVAAPAEADYLLAPGDLLEVKFYYNPELNDQLPVRPDGKISLPLVGEVVAAGRTPAQLAGVLTARYQVPLRRADVAVIVKDTPGRRVFVSGEVTRPGVVRFAGSLTSLQAVVEAGGFTRDAVRRNVVVVRDQGTATPALLVVNLGGSGPAGDVLLQPNDVVLVPRTRIARANQAVDQYVRQLIPIALSFGVSYVLGDRVVR